MDARSTFCMEKILNGWESYRDTSNFTPKKLQGFTCDPVEALGQIALIIELEDVPYQRKTIANFVVVDILSNYNAILGRPMLHKLKAATLIYHYCIKFSAPDRMRVLHGNQVKARSYNISLQVL